jgi:nitrite transporter NirC
MYTETINKCAANAARINRFERSDKLGFWLSSAMAGAYVALASSSSSPWATWWIQHPSAGDGGHLRHRPDLVIIAGSELFTGHTMFLTFGVKTGKIAMADLLRILPQTWAGNLLGSIAVALIYSYGGSLLPDAGSWPTRWRWPRPRHRR